MRFIQPSVKILKENNPFILVEKIGRICYKSTSDYTMETALKFIKSLRDRGHRSVLEHAVFVFDVGENIPAYEVFFGRKTQVFDNVTHKSRCLISINLRELIERQDYLSPFVNALLAKYPEVRGLFEISDTCYHQVPNYKVTELNMYEGIKLPEVYSHLYTTMLFVTDRGVTHEMVRHRVASYTQESTRYCNYSNDKFGSELTFIEPATFKDWEVGQQIQYTQSLEYAERAYMGLTNSGLLAQFARGVLPTDVCTTIAMTANHEEWEHFFDLRSRGVTGAPHPNMKKVAEMAEHIYYEEYNYFKNID